jgi:membrane fusion protein, copper/silver efflux system
VIVALDGGKYRPVEVTLGRENGTDIEVRSGLSDGQKVVASGQFMLDSEASLKSGLSRLDTAPAKAPASHSAQGRIESIDKDGVTITHGPVPSLKWEAMTMEFKSPPGSLPKGLTTGSRIHFEFVRQGDDYVLQQVTPLGAGAKP